MMRKNSIDTNEISSKILQYGSDILNSDAFRKSAYQRHHLHGTVFEHTINVCIVCVRLVKQYTARGVQINEKDLIQAALCHDLGMLERDRKYRGRLDSWKSHPEESVRIAKKLVPDLSREAQEMILTHMWPVAGPAPRSKEGRILCMADKYASMADWRTWLTRHRFAERIKKQLDEQGILQADRK